MDARAGRAGMIPARQQETNMAAKKGSAGDKFEEAKARVEKLSNRPSNDQLLDLYSLYKQATEGDVAGARPGMLDLKGRAKFDAWAKRKGLSKDEAKKKYVAFVDKLQTELG
jgi:diazepam-binding inhibitor (GABA receptor modulating acyl-CoA-binding protein)